MKTDWKKNEKHLYLPPSKPQLLHVPEFNFFVLEGEGNPNLPFFQEYIAVLYSLSYAVKMSPKKGLAPTHYYDYTVYPLEGVWDVNEKAKNTPDYQLDKNDLEFRLMIRQPDFVDEAFAMQMLDYVRHKKPSPLLEKVVFEKRTEGNCIQMMHMGSYATEPESFRIMEAYAESQQKRRLSKIHREIYISDARKTAPEKLKTVLRFRVD